MLTFDHFMHWVHDLDKAMALAAARGFAANPGGRIGELLVNAGWSGRDVYVELISASDRAAFRERNRGPVGLAREAAMAAGGGGGQFAYAVDDLAATVAGVRARGIAVRDPEIGSWTSSTTGAVEKWQSAWLDEGPGGWRPFFIQYPSPRRRSGAWSFRGIELEVPDPDQARSWLARVLGFEPAEITFTRGPRDRIVRVVLQGTGGPAGEFLGITYDRMP